MDVTPPTPPESDQESGLTDVWPWWRAPLVAAVVALPVLATAAGVRLGCDAARLDLALCGATDAAQSAAQADVEVAAGQTTITVTDPAGAAVAVVQEPADQFASPYTKFVVVAPDASRVLYVTAADLGMSDARLWVVPRGGTKRLLKAFAEEFWIAQPVWCQRQPGDPGRIAYVTKTTAGGDQTGLELWVINGDGSGDRRVLIGKRQNGFSPDSFYGDRASPLRFQAGCERLWLSDEDDGDRRVIIIDTGEVVAPLSVPLLPTAGATDRPPGTAVSARPGQPAPGSTPPTGIAQPCTFRPFAQTDPRWGGDVMRAGGHTLRGWGCALTSTAMIFAYFGVDTDPGRLNQCAGAQADDLYWDPVRARCAGDRVPGGVRYNGNATWGDLEAALAAGQPVIVGLQGGPAGSHFLVATGGSGNQAANYTIVDSWDGSTYKTLADYVNPKKGYILKWLIVFEGTALPCTPAGPAGMVATAGGAAAVTDPVAFTSPADGGVYNAPQQLHYTIDATGVSVTASHPDGAIIDGDGVHTETVSVRLGEREIRKSLTFLIDRTPPRVEAAFRRLTPGAGQLDLTAKDDQTVVTAAFYKVDDADWRSLGPEAAEHVALDLKPVVVEGLRPTGYRIRYYAVDAAGNASPEGELVAGDAVPTPVAPASVVPPPTPATTATPPPPPSRPALEPSATELIVAGGADSITLTLRAGEGGPARWSLDGGEDQPWLGVSVRAGELAAGGALDIVLAVNRDSLGPTAPPPVPLQLTTADGATIALTLVVQPPPAATVTPTPDEAKEKERRDREEQSTATAVAKAEAATAATATAMAPTTTPVPPTVTPILPTLTPIPTPSVTPSIAVTGSVTPDPSETPQPLETPPAEDPGATAPPAATRSGPPSKAPPPPTKSAPPTKAPPPPTKSAPPTKVPAPPTRSR